MPDLPITREALKSKIANILGLETSPDGLPYQLIDYDSDINGNIVGWSDYRGELEEIVTLIDSYAASLVEEVINAGDIPYLKLSPCKACSADYMYRCTCSTASDFIQAEQRNRASTLLGRLSEEDKA